MTLCQTKLSLVNICLLSDFGETVFSVGIINASISSYAQRGKSGLFNPSLKNELLIFLLFILGFDKKKLQQEK